MFRLETLSPCVHLRFNLTHNTSLNIVADWAPLSLLPGGTVRQCDAPTPKNYSRTAQRPWPCLQLQSPNPIEHLQEYLSWKNSNLQNPSQSCSSHVPIPDSTGHPPEVPCPCSNLSEVFWGSKGDCHNNKTVIYYDQYINISVCGQIFFTITTVQETFTKLYKCFNTLVKFIGSSPIQENWGLIYHVVMIILTGHNMVNCNIQSKIISTKMLK